MKNFYSAGHAAILLSLLLSPAFAESPENMNRWYEAIRQNNLTEMRALVRTTGPNPVDERGNTPLLWAAAAGSPESVDLLLAAGAAVNTQNAFGVSPLMLAITEPRKVRTLVSHGADVNAKSKVGRTPLLLACMTAGATDTVRLLLRHGALADVRDDAMKTTPLIAATAANATETAELLLSRGAAVNDRDITGVTPLFNAAANGNARLARQLLLRGADVNAVTAPHIPPPVKNGPVAIGSLTPLMMAAAFASNRAAALETTTLLLDARANVNLQDVRGMTALMLAVASDHADPAIIRLLLARGADLTIQDKEGLTAAAWARKFPQPSILQALSITAPDSPVQTTAKLFDLAAFTTQNLKQTVAGSTALLQKTSQNFLKEGGCVSCHAQEFTGFAVRAASDHGVLVDQKTREEQKRATELQFASGEYMLMQRMDPPAVEILTTALAHLVAENAPPSRTTDALVHNLAAQQRQDGSWSEVGVNRAPMAEADFTRTAQAIRALAVYSSAGRTADRNARIERAAAWLAKAHPVTTEDYAMQALGLKWAAQAGVSVKEAAGVNPTIALLSLRNPDGGWSQTPWLASDAYATGEVLYVLHELGMDPASQAYQRGVAYLLQTRNPDGSWHVISRAPKFQPYFESGFPHGGDQWISSAGTAWATAALAYAIPVEKPVLSARR